MAKFCTNCGTQLDDDIRFCTSCGASVEDEQQKPAASPPPGVSDVNRRRDVSVRPQAAPVYEQQKPRAPRRNEIGRRPEPNSPYAPLTTGGFIGTLLLLSIPIVGLILAVVWAFGGCRKINKRNLSRAYLILMVIGIIIGLVIGFAARSLITTALESLGFSKLSEVSELADNRTDVLGGLIGKEDDNAEQISENGSDMDLPEVRGDEDGEADADGKDFGDLVEDVDEINERAEAVNDGWPASLRPYPGGTATAVTSYRTEIRDTSLDEMKAYIETIKADGYAFKDFYDFGMSEQDMLSMNGWWGTDGNIYVSMSYYEDVLTIDHTTELPDLDAYFN